MHSSRFFQIKLIARLILKREISGSHTISDQSLLLSTNVLNDKTLLPLYMYIKFYISVMYICCDWPGLVQFSKLWSLSEVSLYIVIYWLHDYIM